MFVRTMMLCFALAFATACACKESAAVAKTYRNPILPDMADPHVIEVDGTYYLYATSHQRGYDVFVSRDLVNWENKGLAFESPRGGAWAPEIFHDRRGSGKFYLYYTDNDPDLPPSPIHKQIGVAVADSPLGPFVDKGTVVKPAIDAHLYQDDDGQLYLYYVPLPSSGIAMRRMKDFFTPADGDPVSIIEPTEAWETYKSKVAEGPYMLKRDGVYYLTYSGTGADLHRYAIGYATAASPAGPFLKHPGNPIASGNDKDIFGPGHHCIVSAPDGAMWMVYHQKYDMKLSYHRFIALDPIWFDEMDVLHTRVSRDRDMVAPATLR